MIIKRIIRNVILYVKWHSKLRFSFSNNISCQSTFEGMNRIYPLTNFHGQLGFGSYIARNCELSGRIGRFTCIAPNVKCNPGIHPLYAPYVSVAPCFYSLNSNKVQNGSTFATKQMFNEFSYVDKKMRYAVEIGNDVWIGENVFLIGGIHIGDGAVVLAGAVVSKDVPPYAIVAGVPAKVVRYRYDDDTIHFLLNIQWWNNSNEWYQKHWELLCDIDKLKEYYQRII